MSSTHELGWGDEVDTPMASSPLPVSGGAADAPAGPVLPPNEEYPSDEPGVTIVVEYAWKDPKTRKTIVKTSKRVRVFQRTTVKYANSVDVSRLSKFGDAVGRPLSDTTSVSRDPVHIEDPKKVHVEVPVQAPQQGEANFWKKAQEKYSSTGGTGMKQQVPAATAGKYSAATLAAAAAAAAEEDEGPTIDPCCLRISGLHHASTDEDLQKLMDSAQLHVRRIKVIRSKRTGNAIFAFANFSTPQEASRAKDLLDGFGFNHMLLHVQYAEQRKQNIGAQSAMSFVTGYGKALPQNLS